MACYHPIPAYQSGPGQVVRIMPPLGTANLGLPCGKCIGCRTDRATLWAQRCTHEASTSANNSFVTLTYDDEHLPPEAHLEPKHLQDFLKRLRRYADGTSRSLSRNRDRNIRFFGCGEYGTQGGRPHYHALLFNCRFTDTYRAAKQLYDSPQLAKLWQHGAVRIGEVTPASAAYIAQYNIKKEGSGDYIPETGEWRPAPFLRMSRRPAIGMEWLKRYASDLQHGYLLEGGRKHHIPRYYHDNLPEEIQENIDMARYNNRTAAGDKNTEARLQDAEIIHKRRKQLTKQRQ